MNSFFRLAVAAAFMINAVSSSAQTESFKRIRWERERLAPGLVWKSAHTLIDDSVPQNINYLSVNMKKRDISLLYSPEKNVRTSELAAGADAIAAVNAGFFNVKLGGSVTYIRSGGKIVDQDTSARWRRNQNMNGALLIDRKGTLLIGRAMPNHWYDSRQEYNDVLVTGCLLLLDGTQVKMPESSLVINRHPRTVAGLRSRNRAILLTLDGRADQARGMTLPEITGLMLYLRCTDAVNLDGGGSTTMWIEGKPFNGVVNKPSDNKKFDNEGERAVSNILIVK